MSSYLGDMKKAAMLELFNELAEAGIENDMPRAIAAVVKAQGQGFTDQDAGWLAQIASQPSEFKRIFGEKAIPEALQQKMKKCDEELVAAGQPVRFKGLYNE